MTTEDLTRKLQASELALEEMRKKLDAQVELTEDAERRIRAWHDRSDRLRGERDAAQQRLSLIEKVIMSDIVHESVRDRLTAEIATPQVPAQTRAWVHGRQQLLEADGPLERTTTPAEPPTSARPNHLTWNGTEWVDDRCGCRYHADDDNGSHGGAPHVHPCERHAAPKHVQPPRVPARTRVWIHDSCEAKSASLGPKHAPANDYEAAEGDVAALEAKVSRLQEALVLAMKRMSDNDARAFMWAFINGAERPDPTKSAESPAERLRDALRSLASAWEERCGVTANASAAVATRRCKDDLLWLLAQSPVPTQDSGR